MIDPLTLIHGDCVEVMRGMEAESVDAIVTDPPYDLTSGKRGGSGVASVNLDSPYGRALIGTGNGSGGFMGRAWDGTGVAFTVELWTEALRVLKPGGYLLSFGGTRTYHRMTCAIEDAGFEIRDCIAWLYGQGFPKSLDVSKAMDKAAGVEREVVGPHPSNVCAGGEWCKCETDGRSFSPTKHSALTAPSTDLAKKWQGWGTALKPAFEPIVVARKPLIGTVAENVERYGTGALNIDGTRIESNGEVVHAPQSDPTKRRGVVGTDLGISDANVEDFRAAQRASIERTNTLGRWPANVVLSHSPECEEVGTRKVRGSRIEKPSTTGQMASGYGGGLGRDRGPRGVGDLDGTETIAAWDCEPDCAVRLLDEQSGERPSTLTGRADPNVAHENPSQVVTDGWLGTRQMGGARVFADSGGASRFFYTAKASKVDRGKGNTHPTVKPVDLMRWLCRLVTPRGGLILDPFAGSGTTGQAALAEGFRCVLIEREAEYVEGIEKWRANMQLGLGIGA